MGDEENNRWPPLSDRRFPGVISILKEYCETRLRVFSPQMRALVWQKWLSSTWHHGELLINCSASENYANETLLNLPTTGPKPSCMENLPTGSWPGVRNLRLSYRTRLTKSRSRRAIPSLLGGRAAPGWGPQQIYCTQTCVHHTVENSGPQSALVGRHHLINDLGMTRSH